MTDNIVSLYHSSFTGGSKNSSRLLNYMASRGCRVDAYFTKVPDFFLGTVSDVVTHPIRARCVHSDVIKPSTVANYGIAETIVRDLLTREQVTLFGAYLFPFCDILHDVKAQLTSLRKKRYQLVIHPVGSDMWQVGPQLRSRVKWLMDSPLVDTILTYSPGFIDEIREYYNIEREMHVLPPVIDLERFQPLARDEILARRRALGLDADTFIVHHHSSMKRIKCPGTVVEIAAKAAYSMSRKVALIMVGPIPFAEMRRRDVTLERVTGGGWVRYKSTVGKLAILWVGVEATVERLLQIADVELNASLHDSFNVSLMEAMACGVPVVTSDVVGIAEHVRCAEAGVCFPASRLRFDELHRWYRTTTSTSRHFDMDYAVSAIISVAARGAAAMTMGANGARYVAETFTFANAATTWRRFVR